MLKENDIKQELAKVLYPGFSKSIVDFGFVKEIKTEGENVAIMLEITSSAEEVEKTLRDEISNRLATLGVNNLNLAIAKPT